MNITKLKTGKWVVTGVNTQKKFQQLEAILSGNKPIGSFYSAPHMNVRIQNGHGMGFGDSNYTENYVDQQYGNGHQFIAFDNLEFDQPNQPNQWVETSVRKPTEADAIQRGNTWKGCILGVDRRNGSIFFANMAQIHSGQVSHWMKLSEPELSPVKLPGYILGNDTTIQPDGKTVDVGCHKGITFEQVAKIYDTMLDLQEK